MAHAELVQFNYELGSDIVEVHAIVEDCVQVSAATQYDPPEFGSGYCITSFLWDEDLTPDNAPTQADIEKRLPWIPDEDWVYVPPSEMNDDF